MQQRGRSLSGVWVLRGTPVTDRLLTHADFFYVRLKNLQ